MARTVRLGDGSPSVLMKLGGLFPGDDEPIEAQVAEPEALPHLFEATVTNRSAFRTWLFNLLDHAEVLGCDELRDEVVAWLQSMTAIVR